MSRLFSGCLRHDPREQSKRAVKHEFNLNLDGSCEPFEALTSITHAKNFLTMFPNYGKPRFEIAFVYTSFDGTCEERQKKNNVVPRERWIDCLTSHTAHRAPRPDRIHRTLWSQQQEYRKPEPSYDLPSSSSHKKQDHQDEEPAQPGYRMRQPAPPSIEQERKINPFLKIPVTFMFHATYGNQLESRESGQERVHVHLACIDDIIVDDEPSEAELTHVPTGRDALVILAFTKNNPYSFRLSEERTVLTEHTINTSNIIAAFDAEGQILQFNYRILRKNFGKEDKEMHETKITEFADHFFAHVNAHKTTKNQSEKESSIETETRKRRRSTDQDEEAEEKTQPTEERTVKQKLILELHNPDNLSRFIQKFAEVTLDQDMNKIDAAEELKKNQENLRDFMARYNANPRNVYPEFNETEQRSLYACESRHQLR